MHLMLYSLITMLKIYIEVIYKSHMYVHVLAIFYRCSPFVERTVPLSCKKFYNVTGIPSKGNINGSLSIFPSIRQAIDGLLNNTSSTSKDHDSCVQLVQRYFCDFYFPLCDVSTGVITPVCESSCNLLFNNEVCFNLLLNATSMIRQQGISLVPSDISCEDTFLPLILTTEDDDDSEECTSIEG